MRVDEILTTVLAVVMGWVLAVLTKLWQRAKASENNF
jgi:hypothetical protein